MLTEAAYREDGVLILFYIKKDCKESTRLLVFLLLIWKKIPKDPDSFPGLITRLLSAKTKAKATSPISDFG